MTIGTPETLKGAECHRGGDQPDKEGTSGTDFFFQHERLVHLIVTVTFALLEMLYSGRRNYKLFIKSFL